MHEQSAL